MTWHDALGELVDNAFDAGATNVWIEVGPGGKHLIVRDDGRGSSDIRGFLIPGRHSNKRARLGRFGVGLKEAALYLGGQDSELMIKSVHAKKVYSVRIKWSKLIKDGTWLIGPEQIDAVRDAGPGEIGTEITIRPVCRKIPEGKDWEWLLSQIAYTYTPAMANGRQIFVKPKTVGSVAVALQSFRFSHELEPGHVDTTIDVDGKTARVFVGMTKESFNNPRPGITYSYAFRVIEPASSKGCGEFSISRIAGLVQLDDKWTLTKNKNGISREADELFAKVYDACKEVLKRAECASQVLESAALVRGAEDLLNVSLFGDAKGKAIRDPGDTHGTKKPTGKGGKHKRADKEQDGDTFTRGLGGRIRIELSDTVHGIGRFDGNAVVFLPRAHPRIALALKDGDRGGIADIAAALVSEWITVHPTDRRGQYIMRNMSGQSGGEIADSFSALMGKILSQFAMNGTPIVEPAKPSPVKRADAAAVN